MYFAYDVMRKSIIFPQCRCPNNLMLVTMIDWMNNTTDSPCYSGVFMFFGRSEDSQGSVFNPVLKSYYQKIVELRAELWTCSPRNCEGRRSKEIGGAMVSGKKGKGTILFLDKQFFMIIIKLEENVKICLRLGRGGLLQILPKKGLSQNAEIRQRCIAYYSSPDISYLQGDKG